MNILLAFKPEPDAGMLAEKDWQAAALDTCGPDVALLRSAIGADEQAAAALLLAQRNAGCEMTLSALSIGDERALHWLRYFAALGFDQRVLLETAADLRFAPSFIAGQIADWQRSHGGELIVTGCQSSEGKMARRRFCLRKCSAGPASARLNALRSNRFLPLSSSARIPASAAAGCGYRR
jgi:electron transfer flavoprotein alpha/beta subunit